MATGKKSFILYCDIQSTVSKLPDEKAGQLFKLILDYVNDLNPTTDDLLLQIAFEPIKQQLKRDLKTWELLIEKRIKAGKASADKRKQESTHVDTCEHMSTVNDTVTVTVTDNVIVKEKKIKKIFIPPTYEEVLKYAVERNRTDIAKKFFDYFTAGNWIDSKGQKVKAWKQKFITWEEHNMKNNNNGHTNITTVAQHTDSDYLNQ